MNERYDRHPVSDKKVEGGPVYIHAHALSEEARIARGKKYLRVNFESRFINREEKNIQIAMKLKIEEFEILFFE